MRLLLVVVTCAACADPAGKPARQPRAQPPPTISEAPQPPDARSPYAPKARARHDYARATADSLPPREALLRDVEHLCSGLCSPDAANALVQLCEQTFATDRALIAAMAKMSDAELSAAVATDQAALAKTRAILGPEPDIALGKTWERIMDGYKGGLRDLQDEVSDWMRVACLAPSSVTPLP